MADARATFLDMMASATFWHEEKESDVHTHTITVSEASLKRLASALGVRGRYGECVGDAITRTIEDEGIEAEA